MQLFPQYRLALLLLSISGFTALGYQVCWIRASTLYFGSTISALSTVTAAFFAGIAIGAFLLSRVSSRQHNVVKAYGILEICIGVAASITLLMLQCSEIWLRPIYSSLSTNGYGLLIARTILIFCIVTPSSILIGGVFPLLCQLSVTKTFPRIHSAEVLYAASTFGSLVGCIVSGLFLIPRLGITAANLINCGISVSLGTAILLCQKRLIYVAPHGLHITQDQEAISIKHDNPAAQSNTISKMTLYLLFALTGFTALGFEIVWTRFLSLIIHITAFTYVFSLCAILLGITLGSLLLRFLPRNQAAVFFGIVNILIGIVVSITLLRPIETWNWIHDSKDLFQQALFCTSVFLVPSILMGLSFPLGIMMVKSDPLKFGKHIGSLLSVNTLGGIIGSLGVGLFLLPVIGMQNSLLFLTNLSVIVGSIAIMLSKKQFSFFTRLGLCAVASVLWFLTWNFRSVQLPDDFLGRYGRLVEVKEGLSSFLSVVKHDKEFSLEIDGMWQGQKSKDYQIMAAHIPMLLHPVPKKILVIGVGTGQTAQRFLMYDINQLDCADIERELPAIIRQYFDGKWLDDPRVRYFVEDGRMVVSHLKLNYDIVSIEAGQTFRASAAALYTTDFYRKVKQGLNSDGLACQFVPIGFFSTREFASVIRSFIEIFPYSTLWFNKYAEFILIGSSTKQPLLTQQRLQLLISDTLVSSDLAFSFSGDTTQNQNNIKNFCANYLMGKKGLHVIAKDGILYRDDLPELEYRTANIPYSPARFHELIENNLESPDSIIDPLLRAKIGNQTKSIQGANVHITLNE